MNHRLLTSLATGIIISILALSCQKEFTCEGCDIAGSSPVADAGADQVIVLPVNAITLDGSSSKDTDGSITAWRWASIAGPSAVNIQDPNAAKTQVTNLSEGVFRFQLTVTDDGGLTSSDTVQVTVKKTAGLSAVDVYVCGQHNAKAVYWKNGQEVILGEGNTESTATSIAVDGDIVYTTGDIGDLYKYNTNQAVYWRNNVQVALTGETGAGTSSICVAGGDVYVAGWEYKGTKLTSVYWKNGERVSLTDGSMDAEATDILVIGRDVYVCGRENGMAKYWLNGKAFALTNGINQSVAHSIAVVNGVVYVAGAESEGSRMIAKYWKNGQAVTLTDGKEWAIATSIVVEGNDVYLAGYEGGYYNAVAKYWKNGQAIALSNRPGTGYARSIAVYNGDVYVAGYDNGPNQFSAKFWKNQQATPLTGGTSAWATGIAVKPR